MNIKKENLLLYAVTDRTWLRNASLRDAVEQSLQGGATLVQLREKNIEFEDFVKSANEILSVCKKYNVPLIINDNIDVALAVNADGVHLGQGDTPVKLAREILGNDKIIGITAKTPKQAIDAENDGADYIGSGAIFGTSTKTDTSKMSMETLKSITASVTIPVVAIGGITKDNILDLKNSGIAGVAVVSGIFKNDNIKYATQNLIKLLKGVINQ